MANVRHCNNPAQNNLQSSLSHFPRIYCMNIFLFYVNVFHNFYSIFFHHSQQIIVTSSYYYRIYIDLIMIIMMKNSRGLMLNNNKNASRIFIFCEKQFSVYFLFIQTFPENFCHYRKLFHIFICRCQCGNK